MPHRQHAESRRPGQPRHHQRHQRPNQPPTAQRHPQQQHGQPQREHDILHRPLRQGGEFLIRHRDIAGDADGDARPGQGRGGGADRLGGGMAGLKLGKIQHRLGQDKATGLQRAGGAARHHQVPIRLGHPAGQGGLGRSAEGHHGAGQLAQAGLAARHALHGAAQQFGHAAQAGVGGQAAQQRLRLDQPLGQVTHLIEREEQRRMLLEERPCIRPAHIAEDLRLGAQGLGQRLSGAAGCGTRGRIDDHGDHVNPVRKGHIHGALIQPPGQVLREKLRHVRIELKAGDGDPAGGKGQRGKERHHQPGMPQAGAHQRRHGAGHAIIKLHGRKSAGPQ